MNRSSKYRKLLAVFLGICPILCSSVAQAASLIKSESDILYNQIESTSPTDQSLNPQINQTNFILPNLESEIQSIIGDQLILHSNAIDSNLYKILLDSYQLVPNSTDISASELFNNLVGSLGQLNLDVETVTNAEVDSTVIFLPRATAQNIFQNIYDSNITLGEYLPELYRTSSVPNNNITDPGRFEISLFQLPSQPRNLNNRLASNVSNKRFTPDNVAGYFKNNLISRYSSPTNYSSVSVLSSARLKPINLSSAGQIQGIYNPIAFAKQILEDKKDQLENLGQVTGIQNPVEAIIEESQKSNQNPNVQIPSYQSVIAETSNISEKDRKEMEKQLQKERREREKMEAKIRKIREKERKQQEKEAIKRAQQREKNRNTALKKQKKSQAQLNKRLEKSLQRQRQQSAARY